MMNPMKTSISKRERMIPAGNVKGAVEATAPVVDTIMVLDQLRQFQLLLELEDRENDMAGGGVFASYYELD